MGNEDITFQARFSGSAFSVQVPIGAVAAIYARENGQGMGFDVTSAAGSAGDVPADPAASPDGDGSDTPGPNRPKLTRIK